MKHAVLIGLGTIAPTYASAIADLAGKVGLYGVHARSPELRQDFISAHVRGARSYQSIDEIAADPEVDFVILATPPNARAEIVTQMANAGKPILMEKPVERTLAAAERLVETCEAAGVCLGLMFQHRARQSVAKLRDLIRKGKLGQLLAVEISVPWWRAQSYYDRPGSGSYDRDGGGVVISQAIHTLDLALSLAGPVTEVTATASTTGFHDMESEDFVTAGMRFGSGAVGSLFATTAAFPGRPETIRLYYAQAAVTLEADTLSAVSHNGQSEIHAPSDPAALPHDCHREIIADFAAALDEGRPPMVTGREALQVHRVIAALETSAQEGRRIEVAH